MVSRFSREQAVQTILVVKPGFRCYHAARNLGSEDLFMRLPCPVFSAVTADTATLWWEQPDASPENAVYSVTLDSGESVKVQRTHCRFDSLEPGSRHTATVCLEGQTLGSVTFSLPDKRKRLDVTAFGAVGDGATLNTDALQKVIDLCGAAEEVWFPAGVYLTGALRLHSDMAVCLDPGAVLQGTDNPEDYLPKIPSRFEGIEQMCYQSLLNLGNLDHDGGPNARNVLIYGGGCISGGGQPLALNTIEAEKKALGEIEDKGYESANTVPGRARGRLINLSNCEQVRISGLTLQNGASWNVHMVYSKGIVTDHCVFNSENVWNGDGWDPDSSEGCTLFASEFHTGDDAVAIKSGKNPEGNRINRPTRHIRVFDCKSEYGLGVAIGSEMSGGVEDVKIWDCDLEHSLYGVQIKGTKKRGGYVRNISVRDSVLSRFLACAVLYNDDGEGSPVPPVFSGFTCERVLCTGWARDYWEKEDHVCPGIDLSGFDVEGYEATDLTFRSCTLGEGAGIALRHCKNVTIENLETKTCERKSGTSAWKT